MARLYGVSCKGKVVYGLKEADVAWIRENYFEVIPYAVRDWGVIKPTFDFGTQVEWEKFKINRFNPKLKDMAIAVSVTDIITGPEFRAFAPKLVELVNNSLQ